MSGIEFDESCFPLVIQQMDGEITDAQVEGMIRWFDAFFRRHEGERHALIVHTLPNNRALSATQRKRIADWQNGLSTAQSSTSVCTAIVLRSSLQRGALTAMNWLSPPASPQRVVKTLVEGMDYAIEMLEKANVRIPRRVYERREREASLARSG